MKKILVFLLLLFAITGCTSNEYIPTAIVSNISYDETTQNLSLQVEVTDKSNTIENAVVELVAVDEVISTNYFKSKYIYTFNNIDANETYTLKVKATYEMNGVLMENKEIHSVDISSFLSTHDIYFPSSTFSYNGSSHSIYLMNVSSEYTVEYENNNQTEIGIYLVKASVYLDGKKIETYTAYLIISESNPELVVYDQEHYYTSKPITVDYIISNNAEVEITYDGQSEAPIEVGTYNVAIKVVSVNMTFNVEMKIVQANIEIYSSNRVVVYDGNEQTIDVTTNIECDYSITFNGSSSFPTEVGAYDVKISVAETDNHESATKLLKLTILDNSDLVSVDELFISQLVFVNDFDIIVELYNPTQSAIVLDDYSIVIGNYLNNKKINLSGTVNSLSTFTLASENSSYSLQYNQTSNILVASSNQTIALYSNSLLDTVELGSMLNYVRKSSVGFPSQIFNEYEWLFLENDITLTINSHDYKYTAEDEFLSYEIFYTNKNYINKGEVVNFNDHVIVMLGNEQVNVTSSMIKSNNIDITSFGTYSVTFIIDGHEFTTSYIVCDLEGPRIVINDVNLQFSINETINFESLISVYDDSTITEVSYDHNEFVVGVNAITYTAVDVHGNKSTLIVYVIIVE